MVCGQMFYRVAVGELVCKVTAVGEYAGRPLCACFSRALGEMPYTEWAIWCTGIMIMMCAAKKRDRLEILCRVSVKWRLCGRGDEKKLEKA